MPEAHDFLDELEWRGLLKDVTDREGLSKHLSTGSRRLYAGFDPTADSLTIGNLVPITVLAHARRAGHEVIALIGGGTGLIGDPSGKSAERMLLTEETVAHHVECQRPIFEAVLGNMEGPSFEVVNNADWLTKLGYIEVLRDVGKHFSVNMMIQKDSVKSRLEDREQGISYTEFSYMILQAYDFLHLHREELVTIQCGGSDQFGNIVAGVELINRWSDQIRIETAEYLDDEIQSLKSTSVQTLREEAYSTLVECMKRWGEGTAESTKLFERWLATTDRLAVEVNRATAGVWGLNHKRAIQRLRECRSRQVFGFVCPLVTKADGGKFGKTESGAVWLTAARTSPYAYYQFWLNASDEDVGPPTPEGKGGWLRKFTFLSRGEIESIEREHAAAPGKRLAQRTLAREATRLLHGEGEMTQAEAAGQALFSGDIAGLPEATLRDVFGEVPSSEHAKASLAGEGADLVEILVETGLAKSKREAREFVANGSVSVNGQGAGEGRRLTSSDLLHGSMIALRRGKKVWHVTRWA
ncbi:MAG: tyrosine--tRNA ligase [Phycisphaerales bacterium]